MLDEDFLINEQSIDEIINHVGLKCDREQMKKGLSIIGTANVFIRKDSSKTIMKNYANQLAQDVEDKTPVVDEAKCVARFLLTFGVEMMEKGIIDIQDFEAAVRILPKIADYSKEREKINVRMREIACLDSPFFKNQFSTIFIGFFLPSAFEMIYKKKWGVSRPPNGGDLCGPGIRFSSIILHKLHSPRKPEAIYKAYRQMRK